MRERKTKLADSQSPKRPRAKNSCFSLAAGNLFISVAHLGWKMGAKQSQDSTMAEPPPRPPMPSGVVGERSRADEDPEGDGILVPPIFPSLLSTGPADSGYSNSGSQRRSPMMSFFGRQGNDQQERSGEMASLSFGSRSQEERVRDPSHHHHRHHHHHHHHHRSNGGSSSSSSGNHQDRSHHHRRHHRDREHSERHGHDRRARRYLRNGEGEPGGSTTNPSNSLDLDLNFSLIALNQRLRALQLRRENEENGVGGGGEGRNGDSGRGSVGRHRSRSHTSTGGSHSHSQNQFSPGSLFFMRPSSRSKYSPASTRGHHTSQLKVIEQVASLPLIGTLCIVLTYC